MASLGEVTGSGLRGDGVKSADRAMAILEFFRDTRRPATAREIADALVMPRSSTNVLLRSLIAGGYLRYDEAPTAYFPTLRVFQLGSWLIEGFVNLPRIDAAMRRLSEATGETVCLWMQVGTSLTLVSVIPATQAISLTVQTGMTAPVFGTGVGHALLALLSDKEARALRDRWLRIAPGADREQAAEVEARVDHVRRNRGVSVAYDMWIPDAGAVSRAFVHPALGEPAVLAVGGPVFRIRRHEASIKAALSEALRTLETADVRVRM